MSRGPPKSTLGDTLLPRTTLFRSGAMRVTASGRYFSAGIDLHSPLAPDPAVTSPSRFRRWYRQGVGSLHQLGDEWEAVEKPVVVAFQGPCLGDALELSLCADFRLASDDARLGLDRKSTRLNSSP